MIKYQEGFLIAKNLVVMSETSVVADIVERFQCRNTRFQDAHCHFGLNVATIAKALHIFAKHAMQGLITYNGHSAL